MDPTALLLRSTRALTDGVEPFLCALEGAPDSLVSTCAERFDQHRLMPWIEPAVFSDEGRRRLTPRLVAAVEAGAALRRRRHAELVAQTLEIDDAFERAGIPRRHLKGLSFGQRFFPDARRRHQRDVDVLVRPRDRQAALEALERLGYEREPGPRERDVRVGLRRGYAAVDLHWSLRSRVRRRFGEDELFADPVRFELDGRVLETLGDDPTLSFLLLSVCGDLRRGACQVRHLLDLHLVLRGLSSRLDAEAFLARRARQRLLVPCVNVLAVFFSLWDAADELEEFASALLRRRRLVQIRGASDAQDLLLRPRGSAENERWFRRVYPNNRYRAWVLRLTSDLPFTASRLLPSRRFTLGLERRAPGAATDAVTRAASRRHAAPNGPGAPCPDWYHLDNSFSSRRRMDWAHRPIVALACRTLRERGGGVIDLGCGNGALLAKIHALVPDATPFGIERDALRVAHARALLPDFASNFFEADLFGPHPLQASEQRFALAILTPRRLHEAGPERAALLRDWIRARCDRLLVYGYGTARTQFGDLAGFARVTGLELEAGPRSDRVALARRW